MTDFRSLIRRAHLWLGVSVGGLLALLGLTGASLVFYQEIDAALNPEIRIVAPGRAPGWTSTVWDDALATLRARWPDRRGAWRFEASSVSGALPVRYLPAAGGGGHRGPFGMVWMTPDGSRVLRSEEWGSYPMTWIYDLHMALLFGAPGRAVVGWSGLASLAVLATGLWAWWPRGSWAKALRFKADASPIRTLRDAHKWAGLAGFALLAMLSATGAMLGLPAESDRLLARTLGEVRVRAAPLSMPSDGPPITVARALSSARAAMPDARLAWVEAPGDRRAAFVVRVQQPGDPSFRFPHGYVHVDQFSGEVLAVQDRRLFGASDVVNNWLHPLHDGSAGGMALRISLCVAGCLPAVLWITGVRRWRLRVRAASRPRRAR